ncbi:MAG: hypothetical protein ACLR4Z_08590 [Butyricicoccaceae bacterium]
MQGKPVIIRTLDIGGDKEVPGTRRWRRNRIRSSATARSASA